MAKRKQNRGKDSPLQNSYLTMWGYVVVIGIVIVGIVYLTFREDASEEMTAASAEQIALGETVYANQCASCHGVDLEGEANWQSSNPDGTMKSPPHDETGHTWHHGDGYLVSRIRYGTTQLPDPLMQERSNMPAFDGILTDEEIDAVLAYIKNEWPADIQMIQAERTAAEQQ